MLRIVPDICITFNPLIMNRQATSCMAWSLGALIKTFPWLRYLICSEKVILARKSCPIISSATCLSSLRKAFSLGGSLNCTFSQSAKIYLFLNLTIPLYLQTNIIKQLQQFHGQLQTCSEQAIRVGVENQMDLNIQQLRQIMINLLAHNRFWLNRTARQAKFWKPKHYDAIPHYVKPNYLDIHDSYKLRTKEEINAEMADKEFQIEIERVVFNPTDPHRDLKDRKAILIAELGQFNLTQMQLQRLKVLVGCRYNQQSNSVKLTCEVFDNYQQNFTKINEMFYELMLQAKRAP